MHVHLKGIALIHHAFKPRFNSQSKSFRLFLSPSCQMQKFFFVIGSVILYYQSLHRAAYLLGLHARLTIKAAFMERLLHPGVLLFIKSAHCHISFNTRGGVVCHVDFPLKSYCAVVSICLPIFSF